MKKGFDFLLQMRGISFLIVALMFLSIQGYWTAPLLQLNFTIYITIIEFFRTTSAFLVPIGIIFFLIGALGVFETLRRNNSRICVFALLAFLFSTFLFLIFLIDRWSPNALGIQSPQITGTAAPYVLLILVILSFWFCSSLVGFAVALSNIFPSWMRLSGLAICASLPLSNLLSLPPDVTSGYITISILGFTGIGIGFLLNRDRANPETRKIIT